MIGGISGASSYDSVSMLQKRMEFFSKMDANGDGSVDRSEYSSASSGRPGPSADVFISTLDTDGDGLVSQSEFSTGESAFAELMKAAMRQDFFTGTDSNGDGAIDATEYAAVSTDHPIPGAEEFFSALDTDDDGLVTEAEFEAGAAAFDEMMAPPPPPPDGIGVVEASATDETDELIAALDVNGDGAVDQSEMEYVRRVVEMSITNLFGTLDTNSDGTISDSDADATDLLSSSREAIETRSSQVLETAIKAYGVSTLEASAQTGSSIFLNA